MADQLYQEIQNVPLELSSDLNPAEDQDLKIYRKLSAYLKSILPSKTQESNSQSPVELVSKLPKYNSDFLSSSERSVVLVYKTAMGDCALVETLNGGFEAYPISIDNDGFLQKSGSGRSLFASNIRLQRFVNELAASGFAITDNLETDSVTPESLLEDQAELDNVLRAQVSNLIQPIIEDNPRIPLEPKVNTSDPENKINIEVGFREKEFIKKTVIEEVEIFNNGLEKFAGDEESGVLGTRPDYQRQFWFSAINLTSYASNQKTPMPLISDLKAANSDADYQKIMDNSLGYLDRAFETLSLKSDNRLTDNYNRFYYSTNFNIWLGKLVEQIKAKRASESYQSQFEEVKQNTRARLEKQFELDLDAQQIDTVLKTLHPSLWRYINIAQINPNYGSDLSQIQNKDIRLPTANWHLDSYNRNIV